MSQNVYDNPDFFERYARLARSTEGLAGAPEWPTLQSLLPPMDDLRVLDLGCGFGWFSRWARAAGARSVVGIDLSERMLARARAETSDSRIRYVRADLDTVDLEPARFDLVFSSLALHYLNDLPLLVGKIRRALRDNGHFVFSVEHPIFLAPSEPGWQTLRSGVQIWPLDRYLEEGPRVVNWLVDGVTKQHRTIATYLNVLAADGFAIRRIEEWGPSSEQIAEHPEWAVERNRPYFLLVAAQRRQADDTLAKMRGNT